MRRRPSAAVLAVCCFALWPVAICGQSQPANKVQGLVLDISVVEVTVSDDEISKLTGAPEQLSRLKNEGKAKNLASLQVRTRTGESFSTRVGHRVPLQTMTFPISDPARREGQPRALVGGIPQIEYENTGLSVDGDTTSAGDGLIDIKLRIEIIELDTATGRFTPTFIQRTLVNAVRMKNNETALLMGLSQADQFGQATPTGTGPSRSSFVVLVTTRPVP